MRDSQSIAGSLPMVDPSHQSLASAVIDRLRGYLPPNQPVMTIAVENEDEEPQVFRVRIHKQFRTCCLFPPDPFLQEEGQHPHETQLTAYYSIELPNAQTMVMEGMRHVLELVATFVESSGTGVCAEMKGLRAPLTPSLSPWSEDASQFNLKLSERVKAFSRAMTAEYLLARRADVRVISYI